MKTLFQTLKKWWMAFAHALGWLNTRILLSVTYILLGIGAIAMKIMGKDPLKRKFTSAESYWMDKEPLQHTPEEAKRQF